MENHNHRFVFDTATVNSDPSPLTIQIEGECTYEDSDCSSRKEALFVPVRLYSDGDLISEGQDAVLSWIEKNIPSVKESIEYEIENRTSPYVEKFTVFGGTGITDQNESIYINSNGTDYELEFEFENSAIFG